MGKVHESKKAVFALATLLLLITTFNGGTVEANATGEIPPKVGMMQANVNATVTEINGGYWVAVDAQYRMHAVYGYGDSYVVKNSGISLIANPEPYVTITVTQNVLEAHYPFPSNAVNFSAKIGGKEVAWQQDKNSLKILDAYLPQANWTVTPVARDFTMTVHYEQPIEETTPLYSYLGKYAFILPLYGRFGCSNLTYPLYDWSGYSPTQYSIQIQSTAPNLKSYAIDQRGTLTSLNASTTKSNGKETITAAFLKDVNDNATGVQGGLAIFDPPINETQSQNVTLAIVLAVMATAFTVAIALYLKKSRQHKT